MFIVYSDPNVWHRKLMFSVLDIFLHLKKVNPLTYTRLRAYLLHITIKNNTRTILIVCFSKDNTQRFISITMCNAWYVTHENDFCFCYYLMIFFICISIDA